MVAIFFLQLAVKVAFIRKEYEDQLLSFGPAHGGDRFRLARRMGNDISRVYMTTLGLHLYCTIAHALDGQNFGFSWT